MFFDLTNEEAVEEENTWRELNQKLNYYLGKGIVNNYIF
jgi:hypothetical protein